MPIFMLLFCATFLHAQNDFHKKRVQVLPSSELTINGDTNINAFECTFNTKYLKESHNLFYSQTNSTINFTGAILVLDTDGFDCRSKAINKDFQDLIKSDEYPEINLELSQVKVVSPTKGIATVCITIAGKQKFYDVFINLENGEISHYQGVLELDINDFNLEPPKKLFGIIKVKDDIQINFDLRVKTQI